jgi:hypothetical protein
MWRHHIEQQQKSLNWHYDVTISKPKLTLRNRDDTFQADGRTTRPGALHLQLLGLQHGREAPSTRAPHMTASFRRTEAPFIGAGDESWREERWGRRRGGGSWSRGWRRLRDIRARRPSICSQVGWVTLYADHGALGLGAIHIIYWPTHGM